MPNYLNKVAYNIQNKSNSISFMIKCECNTKEFQLLENEESREEKEKRKEFDELMRKYDGEAYSDKNGNIFLCSKGFLGIGRKKFNFQIILFLFKLKWLKPFVLIAVRK